MCNSLGGCRLWAKKIQDKLVTKIKKYPVIATTDKNITDKFNGQIGKSLYFVMKIVINTLRKKLLSLTMWFL